MNFRRVLAIFKRNMYETRHSPGLMFDIFYWPMLDLFVWGLVTAYLRRAGTSLPLPVAVLLGGTMLWGFLFRAQLGMTITFLIDAWSRNILGFLASPLRPVEYVAGAALWSFAQLVAGWTVMGLLAWGLFSFSILDVGLALIPFVAVLALFGIAIALFVLGIVIRLGNQADILAWGLAALISPLAAVYYPVATLPEWGQWVAAVLPPAHVFEGMRAVLGGSPVPWGGLGTALALDLVYVVAAAGFARAMFSTLRRRGYVTRYAG